MPSEYWKSGVGLLSHLIEILINERLFRDLKNAQNVNLTVDKLEKMVSEQLITTMQMEKINSVLKIRKVEITEVRPDQKLQCSAFSGFFSKADRIRLVEQGRKATLETLARIPEHNPTGEQTT